MNFKIKFGNLVEAEATFIVNASNTELTLGSGVSHAFSQHCGGDIYQKELYEIKKSVGAIKQGDVIVSGPGSAINFKYALHVAVMNYSDSYQTPYPTYKQMQSALNSMLGIIKDIVQSEKIEKPRIAISLLGCGVGGLSKEKIFLIIKSIFKKSELDLEVLIYFHNKKDYYEFASRELQS
jgi:O-acetyl-ADP-ribose deacetylase (regulator of RNase III)